MNLVVVSVASLAILVVVHRITFAIGRRIGRYNVVDVAWVAGFVAVAAVAARAETGKLSAGSCCWHWFRCGACGWPGTCRSSRRVRARIPVTAICWTVICSAGPVVRRIFAIQAAATWFVSLPLQLSAVQGPTPAAWWPVLIAGVVLWGVGVAFEAVGDHQLRRFKSDPANKGVVMDRGLWAWTRHPNDFGDACVWWGLWLVTITGWLSLSTVASPLLMSYFLAYAARAGAPRSTWPTGALQRISRSHIVFVPKPPRLRLP